MVHNPGGDWHPGWGVDLRYNNLWEGYGKCNSPGISLFFGSRHELNERAIGEWQLRLM